MPDTAEPLPVYAHEEPGIFPGEQSIAIGPGWCPCPAECGRYIEEWDDRRIISRSGCQALVIRIAQVRAQMLFSIRKTQQFVVTGGS